MSYPTSGRTTTSLQRLFVAVLFFGAALGLGSGCSRTEPVDKIVDAESSVAFAMWKSRAVESLSPEQARDFDLSVQEIKFKIMADGEATGSVAIDNAMRAKIDRSRISQVIEKGLRLKLQRLEVERAALADALKHNLQMRTRPGDTESAEHLNSVREADARRLEAVRRDLTATEEKLDALLHASPYLQEHPSPLPRASDPTEPPRRPSHEA